MNPQKIATYFNTIRYLKPGQIYYRVKKMLKMNCSLGGYPEKKGFDFAPQSLETVEEFDFDSAFLARFPLDEIMADKVILLHETETFCWDRPWNFPHRTPLWNYNLHYLEYLFPLVKAYKDIGDRRYLDKIKTIIRAWIKQNPRGTRPGWEPYPIALRLTNWLSIYTHLESDFKADPQFHSDFIYSIWEQYDFLAHHLEKHLLGNHYFENLKALILCSLFFKDKEMQEKSLTAFYTQCREQILPDGMHFELSPMYHKLILEDVMRVAVALRGAGKRNGEIENYLQSMLDVAYSLEEGLERLPLFNDCGNNVAKNLSALCEAAKAHFDLIPKYKGKMPDSGYYIFKKNDWKLIIDAGQPGPTYLPGHAHCDAMSFELFKSGKPVIVNCGTYAYQCDERAFFRSTAAHNTVQVEGVEQSQCWGAFRMGKRSSTRVTACVENHIEMSMRDQNGNVITRTVTLSDAYLSVSDVSGQNILTSFLHLIDDIKIDMNECEKNSGIYSDEFGSRKEIGAVKIRRRNGVKYKFDLIAGALATAQSE